MVAATILGTTYAIIASDYKWLLVTLPFLLFAAFLLVFDRIANGSLHKKPTIMPEKFSITVSDIQKADSIEDLKEKVAALPEDTEVLIYYATIEQAD